MSYRVPNQSQIPTPLQSKKKPMRANPKQYPTMSSHEVISLRSPCQVSAQTIKGPCLGKRPLNLLPDTWARSRTWSGLTQPPKSGMFCSFCLMKILQKCTMQTLEPILGPLNKGSAPTPNIGALLGGSLSLPSFSPDAQGDQIRPTHHFHGCHAIFYYEIFTKMHHLGSF